jgi:predicted ribosomally synthesized peptide with nif11-like leader
MPIDKNEITKEMIEKAMQCETADELIALANSEGIELTKEEAEAYLAELEDFELDSDVLQKVAGGGVYETVSTIIKEVPNVVKNI